MKEPAKFNASLLVESFSENNFHSKLNRTAVRICLLLSFILRTAYAVLLGFDWDQLQVYRQGLDFYLDGKLSTYGAAVVYTGTAVPGSLQSVLAGIPLFFSHGLPWGMAVFIGLLNSVSTWMIFKIMVLCFPKFKPLDLALFILFAPWTLLFNPTWNPSYLPFFSALWLWGILLHFKKPGHFWAAFLIGLSMVATLQLHLSCVLLPLGLGLAWFTRSIILPNWKGLFTGASTAGITLIPFFLEHTSKPSISSNIQIRWEHLQQWPAFFLRFLSFPTAETTRFIGQSSGLGGALAYLNTHRIWIPFAFFSISMSACLIGVGFWFYIQPKNWKLKQPKTQQEVLKILTFLLPLITGVLFGFSVTGPSAHTFWILLPLSFAPLLFTFNQYPQLFARIRPLWLTYCVIAPLFSLGTYWDVDRQSLYQTQEYAVQLANNTLKRENIPQNYIPGIDEVLRAKKHFKSSD